MAIPAAIADCGIAITLAAKRNRIACMAVLIPRTNGVQVKLRKALRWRNSIAAHEHFSQSPIAWR